MKSIFKFFFTIVCLLLSTALFAQLDKNKGNTEKGSLKATVLKNSKELKRPKSLELDGTLGFKKAFGKEKEKLKKQKEQTLGKKIAYGLATAGVVVGLVGAVSALNAHKENKDLAEDINTAFLGEVPLVQSIREAGDVGHPVALQENTPLENAFSEITKNTLSQLVKRNTDLPPTEVVRITTMSGCSTN